MNMEEIYQSIEHIAKCEMYDAIEVKYLKSKFEELQQENKQLKIQINAREEVCNRLESNWNKLKEYIRKNIIYEKAIEPYQRQINELEKKLYYLKQDIEALYLTGKELINSIDRDYLNIIINIDEPKAYFKEPELVETTVKRIAVPIKQDLLENYVYWINYYKSKHKLGDKENE